MCENIPSPFCYCTDYLLPKYGKCHPIMCHNISICKLRRLLDEPMSADCYEQQTFYLYDYLKCSKYGYHISDLIHLNRVIEILVDRIDTTPIYHPYIKKMFDIAALPLIMHNLSEELSHIGILSEYLGILGFCGIWLHDISLRNLVYKAITQLLTVKESNAASIKLSMRYQAAETSILPEIIAQLLDLTTNDEYYAILNISSILTKISSTICEKMAFVSIMEYVLLRLLPNQDNVDLEVMKNITHSENYMQILNLSLDILLTIVSNIKYLSEEMLKKVTPGLNALWSVRYVFRGLLYGKYSQQQRNSLMVFIMLCLDTFPYLEITECHLLDDLALLSVATEIKTNTWVSELTFTNSEYDVFFKKMLVLTLSYTRKYPRFNLIFEYRDVIPGLLKILATEYITDWHAEEYGLLIQYTLSTLYYIIPKLINVFLKNDGVQSLLIMIETYHLLANDCNRQKLEGALRLLGKIANELRNELAIEIIEFNSGILVLNSLIEAILRKEMLVSNDQELLGYAFHILSSMYEEAPPPNDPTVNNLIVYLKRIISPNLYDSCINPRAVICAIYLLWEIILVDDDKLREFIKMEGVYMILDIIDTNTFPVKVIGLGCLTDICEDSFCVPFLLTWRGGKDKKKIFHSLLASIFRLECKKIGTKLNSNDIITDIDFPLIGTEQYQEIMAPKKDCHSSASIVDMFGSCRPKIYALLQFLNLRYKKNVQLIDEHYKISNCPIPRNDRVILHLAENYFALKLNEAWQELKIDLSISNIVPVELDRHMLTILTEQMHNWNKTIQKGQETIFQNEILKAECIEMNLYNIFRKCRLQNAIKAMKEIKLIARTTDAMFRKAHKEKQQKQIKQSIKNAKDEGMVETTYDQNINVTLISSQKYEFKNNKTKKILFEADNNV